MDALKIVPYLGLVRACIKGALFLCVHRDVGFKASALGYANMKFLLNR